MKNLVKTLICVILLSLTTITIAAPGNSTVSKKRFIFFVESKNYVSPYVHIRTITAISVGSEDGPAGSGDISFTFNSCEDRGPWTQSAALANVTVYGTVDNGTIPISGTIEKLHESVNVNSTFGGVFYDDVVITSADPSTIDGLPVALAQ